MAVRYIYTSRQLPEVKMRLYPTKVINIIGGPACNKSLFSAAIILHLHLRGKTVEQIPDYARSLVWQRDYEYDTRTVEIFIGRLRKKIDSGSRTPLVHTVRSVGYSVRLPT